jgi:hypothetical protein
VNGGRGGKQRSRVGGGQGVVGVSHAPNIEQSGLPGQCRFRDFGQTGGRTPRGVLHPGRWHVGPLALSLPDGPEAADAPLYQRIAWAIARRDPARPPCSLAPPLARLPAPRRAARRPPQHRHRRVRRSAGRRLARGASGRRHRSLAAPLGRAAAHARGVRAHRARGVPLDAGFDLPPPTRERLARAPPRRPSCWRAAFRTSAFCRRPRSPARGGAPSRDMARGS